jgi:hypothetical protein
MPGAYPESTSGTPAPQQTSNLGSTLGTSSTGIPDRTRDATSSTTGPTTGSAMTSDRDHHYGRDAALAGGAAGLAGAGA